MIPAADRLCQEGGKGAKGGGEGGKGGGEGGGAGGEEGEEGVGHVPAAQWPYRAAAGGRAYSGRGLHRPAGK